MSDSGARRDRPLERLLFWARKCLGRSYSLGLEPEDLLHNALVKGLERSVIVRERAEGPQVVWLRRAMEFEVSYRRRRRRPSTRPRRATPLPWGHVELVGEELERARLLRRDPLPTTCEWALLQAGLWNERVTLLLVDCFSSSWDTSCFLLDGRSRDAARRLRTRAVTRVRQLDRLEPGPG